MLKALLIDDEPNNLKSLQHDLLTCCPQVDILATCQSGKEGLISIHKYRPDLVFLDIEMPAMTGLEMLQCLETIYFDVIFTTAHEQFAASAFRISNVVDYLVKPIKKEHLREAVRRVENKSLRGLSTKKLDILNTNLNTNNQIIPLSGGEGLDLIKVADIIYARSEGNYITIYTSGGKTKNSPYSSFTLSYLEEQLPSFFCRIHQSYLINIHQTNGYNRNKKYVLMINKEKLPVSNGGRSKLLSKLNYK